MAHIALKRAVICLDCDTIGSDLNRCVLCLSTAVYPLARFLSREAKMMHEFTPKLHYPTICQTCGGMRITPSHGYDMAAEVAKVWPADVKAFLLSPQAETLVEVVERVQGA